MRWRAVLGPVLLAAFAASCGPSYPKERLAQALEEMCRREHGLEIKAQVVGTTLGVMVPIPGLMEELRKRSGSSALQLPVVLVEGNFEEHQRAFDFQVFTRGPFTRVEKQPEPPNSKEEPSEPIKKLQRVSTAILRAALSTDAKLEFYQLTARDPGPDHLDLIFKGHIQDSKRVQFYAISMSELHTRSDVFVRIQPEALAKTTVQQFLADLGKRPLPQLLSRYTSPDRRFGDFLPKVLLAAVAVKDQEQKLIAGEMPSRQIAQDVVLVYVPLEPAGSPGALLFTVELGEGSGTLSDIQVLETNDLPANYRALGNPKDWNKTFFLEPISLPEFLTDQIAKRVLAQFRPLDPEAKMSSDVQPSTTEEVTKTLAETTAYVVNSYEFSDFEKVAITDGLRGTRWEIQAGDLPLYRRRPSPELKPLP